MNTPTIQEMLLEIKVDVASLKTDVSWLKRLFTGSLIGIGILLGVDLSGVMI